MKSGPGTARQGSAQRRDQLDATLCTDECGGRRSSPRIPSGSPVAGSIRDYPRTPLQLILDAVAARYLNAGTPVTCAPRISV